MVNALRRERAVRLLVPLFFVSGLTALIYQSIWARQLQLVFGTSQFAIATVLAAFMAGLAAGGFLMARYADRLEKPLLTYGVLEIIIGVYAMVFPVLLKLATPIYLSAGATTDSPVAFGIFQFLVVSLLLLVPTTCMGATLPLLGRFVTTRLGSAGDRIGLLYGVNTAGAVIGILIAGFWLLPTAGLMLTTAIAAVANLVLGAAAIWLSRWQGEGGQVPEVEDDVSVDGTKSWTPVMICAALTGFSALICEVAWFRLIGLVLGGSTYAFSTMLLAFLSGIAFGGWVGGKLADGSLTSLGKGGPLKVLAALQAGIAVLTYSMMYLYDDLPVLFLQMYASTGGDSPALWPLKVVLAALVMTPPAVLMGASFPFLVRSVVGKKGFGKPVGQVYGANTLGSIFGAFLGGFVLLPQLDVVGTLLVAGAANLAAVLVAFTGGMAAEGNVRRGPQGAVVFLAVSALLLAARFPPPWEPLLMTAGVYKYASDITDPTKEGLIAFAVEDYDLLFYDEGLSTVVTVAQSRLSGNIWLANNGKVDASTTIDMPTQVLVTHLPFLFAKDPREVVVIGLASGITLGSVTLYDELEEIQVVELEPAIVEASHYFDDYNNRPLSDPRVTLHANDGRNHLLLAGPERYDVVVSEPSNPWISGVSNLFTREFFTMGKSRLRPGGIWSQWVQLYGMAPEDLQSLLATFADVYAHVALFATIEDADLVLVGSDSPLDLNVANAQALLDNHPKVSAELRQIGVVEAHDLLTFYQFGRDEILELSDGVVLNTDDNMRIEYSAPRHLHSETSEDNFLLLLPKSKAVEIDGLQDNLSLARAYGRREEWIRALVCVNRALALAPDNDEAQALRFEFSAELEAELYPED